MSHSLPPHISTANDNDTIDGETSGGIHRANNNNNNPASHTNKRSRNLTANDDDSNYKLPRVGVEMWMYPAAATKKPNVKEYWLIYGRQDIYMGFVT